MVDGSEDGFTRGVLGMCRMKRAAEAAATKGASAKIEVRIVKRYVVDVSTKCAGSWDGAARALRVFGVRRLVYPDYYMRHDHVQITISQT